MRKARDKVFHLNCFTCCICRKQLSTGEQLHVLDDNKFICKEDYLLGKGHHNSLTGEFLCNVVLQSLVFLLLWTYNCKEVAEVELKC